MGLDERKATTHLTITAPPHRKSVGALSKRAELSSGAMTNRLDRMENAGLVKRVPDPDDRRGVLVELTKEGHRLWGGGLRAPAANESLIAAALTEGEKRPLDQLLRPPMRRVAPRQ